MTREMFVRVATRSLQRSAGQPPEIQAEAIAMAMDLVADALGDGPAPLPAEPRPNPSPGMVQAAAFPAPNPEALAPPPSDPVFATPPMREPEPSLITTDTRMPSAAEIALARAREPEPVRSLRAGPPAAMKERMKVEDLNALIQKNTPPLLMLDIPMEDGPPRRVYFERDTLSRHALDSVQLVYYPQGARGSARELTEVMASISIDDLPIALGPVIEKLKAECIESVRPKGPPREVPVRPFGGPVTVAKVYESGGSSLPAQGDSTVAGALAVMGTIG